MPWPPACRLGHVLMCCASLTTFLCFRLQHGCSIGVGWPTAGQTQALLNVVAGHMCLPTHVRSARRDCCAIIVTQFETEIGRGCVILKPSFSTDGVILVSM